MFIYLLDDLLLIVILFGAYDIYEYDYIFLLPNDRAFLSQ